MARRDLPTAEEALRILATKRSRPARRPPPPAGRALTGLIRELDKKYGQGPGALQARWKEIVGEQIAARCEPVKLIRARGSTPAALEVRVAGAAAALIQHQAAEILSRVNLFLGDGAVTRLRIIQGPLRPKVAEAPKAVRKRITPLDAAKEAELAEGLADAPEGPMKSALLQLGRAVLRRGPA